MAIVGVEENNTPAISRISSQ